MAALIPAALEAVQVSKEHTCSLISFVSGLPTRSDDDLTVSGIVSVMTPVRSKQLVTTDHFVRARGNQLHDKSLSHIKSGSPVSQHIRAALDLLPVLASNIIAHLPMYVWYAFFF